LPKPREGGYLTSQIFKFQIPAEQLPNSGHKWNDWNLGFAILGFSIWAANVRHFAHRAG